MDHLYLEEEMWLIFLIMMVQSQGQMKVIAIWQIVLYSNYEGQSGVLYITDRNCLILWLSIKLMKVITVMLLFKYPS